jgi:hypothetical protein
MPMNILTVTRYLEMLWNMLTDAIMYGYNNPHHLHRFLMVGKFILTHCRLYDLSSYFAKWIQYR